MRQIMEWDNIIALCEVGDKYASIGCYAKAMQCWFLAAEDTNDYEAKYRLGYCYFKGNELVNKDMFRAIYWLKQSSEKGSYKAAKILGGYYESLAYGEDERIIDDPNNQQLSIWNTPCIEIKRNISNRQYLEKALVYYYQTIINLSCLVFKSSFEEITAIVSNKITNQLEAILKSSKQDELKINKLRQIIGRLERKVLRLNTY